jgi:hypothetical protein
MNGSDSFTYKPRYRVIYLVKGRERRSHWIMRASIAETALKTIQAKYGERNAIIYFD